ncbi:hypothetical protein [Hahella ganghwensis]|uniref:hypothetical protein n=1 Tax=Hahella ganghwensis TaxID=286420 RepID=UPI000376E7F2|nr:hypothetical protein [Hahella ganghwensis]
MKRTHRHHLFVLILLSLGGVSHAIELAPRLESMTSGASAARVGAGASYSEPGYSDNVEFVVPGEVFEEASLSELNARFDDFEDVEYLDDSSFIDIRTESGVYGGAGYDSYGYIAGSEDPVDVLSYSVWGASENLSVSDVMDSEAIAQDWGLLQGGVREFGKNIRNSVGAQLDEIRGLVGADLFVQDYQRRSVSFSDSGRSGGSGRNASQMNSYASEDAVPFIYKWLYKVIRFKNENPVAFYSILVFVIFLLVMQSIIVGVMGSGRRRAI